MTKLPVIIALSLMMIQCQDAKSQDITYVTSLEFGTVKFSACRVKRGKVVCATHDMNTFPSHWAGAVFLAKHCLSERVREQLLTECFNRLLAIKETFGMSFERSVLVWTKTLPLCTIIEESTPHESCVEATDYRVNHFSVYP